MRYTWSELSKEQVEEIRILCPPGEYRIIKPSLLSSYFAEPLIAKSDSFLIVASGIPDGVVYYMVNINRLDGDEIDQQPFGFVVSGTHHVPPSGCYIHHGEWEGRTTKAPSGFFDYVTMSGVGNCYPISELPTKPSGRLDEFTEITSTLTTET